MTGYNATISDSSIELSPKQKVMLKDTTDCVGIDKATQENGAITIKVAFWVELSIHNERSQDKDYKNYVVVADDGTRYVTGSESFWTAFRDIYDEMASCDEEWSLKIYRCPSKNRQGKDFITCSIV